MRIDRRLRHARSSFDTSHACAHTARIMSFPRPIVFWVAVLAAVLAVVILLREVLLPFVAGIVLAYLLDPLAARIERLGMNRLLATLVIIAFVVVTIAALMVLTLPVIIRELAYFIESFPLYVNRLHTLAADPSRPWLSTIIEEGPGRGRTLARRASEPGEQLVRHLPALCVVGGTGPDLDHLARDRGSDCCLLSPLRLGQDDRGDRQLGSTCANGRSCGRLRVKSTTPSAGSCEGRARFVSCWLCTMPRRCG